MQRCRSPFQILLNVISKNLIGFYDWYCKLNQILWALCIDAVSYLYFQINLNNVIFERWKSWNEAEIKSLKYGMKRVRKRAMMKLFVCFSFNHFCKHISVLFNPTNASSLPFWTCKFHWTFTFIVLKESREIKYNKRVFTRLNIKVKCRLLSVCLLPSRVNIQFALLIES